MTNAVVRVSSTCNSQSSDVAYLPANLTDPVLLCGGCVQSSTSGFDSCAQALLNESAAKVSEAIQPNNRPFASMELSMLATERKALITRAIDPQGCYHAAQIRDLGVLLLHAGRFAEGISLLESYQEWLATPSLAAISGEHEHAEETGCCGMTEREEAPGSFAVLVAELLHYERRKGLEAAFSL
mmetsp:Transcript_19073/g.41114  ORF Transcript_19073/g.41114 Transcript_19073/m.41114 type:complete len:184 (+) Transcript_19073:1077-1628(+)